MTPDPKRVQEILNEALLVPADQRAAFVTDACGNDSDLQLEVESLLQHASDPVSPIEDAITTPGRFDSSSDSIPDKNIGRVIDRYTITALLGEGGFGMVYRASQTDPIRRDVALKIIKPGMDTKKVLSRFETERQALALMDHPGVARILDAGSTEQGFPFFVMEHVKGISLTKFADMNRLRLKERIHLFMNVCEAVQHAHSKGIIHRDLKPGNILATYENGRPAIKIIDFGIAKAVNQSLSDSKHVTQEGRLIGTPEYMSPEQAQMSAIDVDTRSDVYSLGVVLYELLAGGLPFESRTLHSASLAEIQRIIREDDPPKPSLRYDELRSSSIDVSSDVARSRSIDPMMLQKRLRGDLDWIIMKCLEKSPVRRYPTSDALASDLRRYLANEPVEAGPPTIIYRFKKFAIRRTGLLASTALVFIVLLVGIISSTMLWVEANNQRIEVELRDRELVKLFFDYDDIYRDIYLEDGTMENRDDIIGTLSPSIDALLDSDPTNPKYRAAKVQGLLREAELVGGRRSANLGDKDAAMALRKQARDISSTLAEENPHELEYRKLLSVSFRSMGDSYKDRTNYQDALTAYSHALVEAERRSEADVPNQLVYSLQMSIGDMHKKSGNSEEARTFYDLSMGGRKQYADNHPNDPMARRDVANMYLRLAVLARDSGEHEQSLESFNEALAINMNLLKTDPEHTATHRRDSGNAHSYIADTLLKLDQPEEANEYYSRSLELLTEGLRLNPGDTRIPKDLKNRLNDSDKFTGEDVENSIRKAKALLER